MAMEFQIWTSEFWWDEATANEEYGERIYINVKTIENM